MPPGADEDGRGIIYDPALAARLLKGRESEREKSRRKKIREILAIAVSIFAREGIRGFSTRRIAADTGISLSSLQHYFGTRDNLLVLTINSLVAGYIADYTDISRDTSLTPRQRLDRVLDDLFEAIADPVIAAFYVNLWPTMVQEDKNVVELVRESYTRYYDALTTIISSLRPDLPRERAAMLGLFIGSQIDGLLVTKLVAPHGLPDWESVKASAKAMWVTLIDQATPAAPNDQVDRRDDAL